MKIRKLSKGFAKPSPFLVSLGAAGATLLLSSVFVALAFQSNSSDLLSVLGKGQPFSQRIARGETQYHRMTAGPRQYLRLMFSSTTLNLRLTLLGPDRSKILEQDCPRNTPTPISFIADVAGEYVVKVQPLKEEFVAGDCKISLANLREEKPDDRHRITAENLMLEGTRLSGLESPVALRSAIKMYEQAANAWNAAGDQREQASTFRAIAELFHKLGQPQEALAYSQNAQRISQALNDVDAEAEALNSIGYAYLTLGETDNAWKNCYRALELSRCTGNHRVEAESLNDLGEVLYGFSKLQQSIGYYQEAITIWRELADDLGQARTLLNFGYTYSDLGEPNKALEFDRQALTYWKAANNKRGQALTLTALGRLNSRLGESQEAIRYFNQAMPLARLVGDQTEEARILNGLGFVQESLGEQQKAIEYYNLALCLFQAVSYPNGEASTYFEIGRAYFSLADLQHAFEFFQRSYVMCQSVSDKRLESYALRGMGLVYDEQGNKPKALEAYRKALPIYQKEKDRRGEALTQNSIGHIYQQQGKLQVAIECYKKALALNQAAGDRNRESQTLYNLACAERDRGQFAVARSMIQNALEIVESLRTKVASRDLRTSYFATIQQYYQLDVDLLMQSQKQGTTNNWASQALEVNERARARSLLDLLGESRIDVGKGTDAALVQRLRAVQQELAARSERNIQLLSAKASLEEIAAINREISALTEERDKLEAQIRLTHPHYAALTQPQPLSAQEIQQLLTSEVLLLELSLGDKRSYVWAVTPTEVKGYELAGRAQIERAAEELYRVMAPDDDAPLQLDQQRAELFWKKAEALSELILAPVANELGQKRLVIVADGILLYIPFSVLPKPGAKGATSLKRGAERQTETRPIPLVVEHEIVNLPSASTLAVLRREAAGRKEAPKMIAVLADPVFDANDWRLLSLHAQPTPVAANGDTLSQLLERRLKRGGILKRLRGTLGEAKAIEDLTAPSDRLIAVGFDANLRQATSPELGQFRIIHFATHGLLNSDNPSLSSLVFSLFDKEGNRQDGNLRLQDIYNLRLPAELVVLSACETGLGKEFKGEGLIGLTRGFMYAGAPRVMASLWKVDDEPTAKLMRYFYEHLLKEKMSPAAALRAAQLTLSQDAEWSAPYHWGSFVLQGEWK